MIFKFQSPKPVNFYSALNLGLHTTLRHLVKIYGEMVQFWYQKASYSVPTADVVAFEVFLLYSLSFFNLKSFYQKKQCNINYENKLQNFCLTRRIFIDEKYLNNWYEHATKKTIRFIFNCSIFEPFMCIFG
jgi:hypothetical protein